MSANPLEQQAAIYWLSTLMSIAPKDTYIEFEKHLKNLPDRYSHDRLLENDIQIFHTPDGMLSSEQGVYVAKTVAAKNTKHAKSHFRLYEDQDDLDHVCSNHSAKREPVSREPTVVGRKDTGKSTKKDGKEKAAKEEAQELLLKEEASICEQVREIQTNLSF